jgi:hypothetical protein
MKSNNTKFRSLNEAIQSVTNPQPKVSSSLVEEQKYIEEYIAMLETALESIAEELECSVEDLLEDVQTPQRKAEGEKDIKNLKRKAAEKMRIWVKVSDPHTHSPRAYEAGDRYSEANSAKAARQDKQSAEQASSDTYGKGGKIIKKATMKEEQDLSEDLPPKEYVDKIKKKTQDARAAAMKDRNSGAHRTPAELKKFAASQSAYVKSQNNRTDSKGKKLDPYDDYQS